MAVPDPEVPRTVAGRPFVDTPVGDLEAAAQVAAVAATRWHLAPPRLLRAGMNAVFTSDDAVIRVGRPTAPPEGALELARRLATVGVRVPRALRPDPVVVGAMTATCWERVPADPGTGIDWEAVGRMVARLHRFGGGIVPDGHPCPSAVTFPWWDLERLLEELADDLDTRATAGLSACVQRHRDWRADASVDTVVCHGDVHPGNVVQGVDGPVLLDWDLLCRAPRGWDHGPMMTWAERWGGAVGEYEAFAEGYGWSGRGDAFAEAVAELRLVAATLMRVRAARIDPAAREEAERRLSLWRGDPGAPAWRAQ